MINRILGFLDLKFIIIVHWQYTLYQRSWLMMLLICNILGMIYGYIWYGEQLSHTPWHFKIFVPDSPTAILY
ncbi:hypothetical protein B8A12_01900, partial [Staphylococcus aureus]